MPEKNRARTLGVTPVLLDGTRGLRLQLDLAEGGLILRHVLLQNVRQRFGLLRAQENALKILDADGVRRSLVHGSEQQEEIPQADAHLHAVGVMLAVVGGARKLDLRLRLLRSHMRSGYRAAQHMQNKRVVESCFSEVLVAPRRPEMSAT